MASKLSKMSTKTDVSIIGDSLKALSTEKAKLEQYEERGQSYIQSMKRGDGGSSEEFLSDMAIDVGAALRRKNAKTLTLEEQYEQEWQHQQQTNFKACSEMDGPHLRLLVVDNKSPRRQHNTGKDSQHEK